MAAFVIVVLIRGGSGVALAAAYGAGHQVSGPVAALSLGVAAPIAFRHLAAAIPLAASPEPQLDGPFVASNVPVQREERDLTGPEQDRSRRKQVEQMPSIIIRGDEDDAR